MSFDATFLRMMGSVATIAHQSSDDGWGNRAWGTAVSVPCHISYRRRILRTDTDEEAVSTAEIQMPPAGYVWSGHSIPRVTVADDVVLPDSATPRRVLEVKTFTDQSGEHHQTLSLT